MSVEPPSGDDSASEPPRVKPPAGTSFDALFGDITDEEFEAELAARDARTAAAAAYPETRFGISLMNVRIGMSAAMRSLGPITVRQMRGVIAEVHNDAREFGLDLDPTRAATTKMETILRSFNPFVQRKGAYQRELVDFTNHEEVQLAFRDLLRILENEGLDLTFDVRTASDEAVVDTFERLRSLLRLEVLLSATDEPADQPLAG